MQKLRIIGIFFEEATLAVVKGEKVSTNGSLGYVFIYVQIKH
jgi:hypothetical protein